MTCKHAVSPYENTPKTHLWKCEKCGELVDSPAEFWRKVIAGEIELSPNDFNPEEIEVFQLVN